MADEEIKKGRPLAPISAEQVFRLAKLGLTQSEIAEVFGVTQSAISKRFSAEFASARGQWKLSIRRAQTRRAVKDGSDAMLIHLGKTYLDQPDRLDITSDGQPITSGPVFEIIDNRRNPAAPIQPPTETAGSASE